LPSSHRCPDGTPIPANPALPSHSVFHLRTSLPYGDLFPAGAAPPTRPNSDPRCNRPPPSSSTLPLVVTPLRRDAWAFHLRDYPDRSFVDTLLHIIDHGALLGFDAPDHSQNCKNLTSCAEQPAVVTAAVGKLLQNSHALGPYLSPPLPNFRSSPLGLASRKRSSKLRLINHLSWPHGDSVNAGIPDSEASIQYESFETALQVIRAYGPGSLLAKLDLKEAFHHIPVAPSQWHLLGFHWQSQFYHMIVLTFGLRSAPYIFNLFAEGLHWIISRHLPGDVRHYLDDFLPIFHPTTPLSTAKAAISWCQSLGEQLGLIFQQEKTILPCTSLEYLGLEIDTLAMEARLPPDKLDYLREILDSAIMASTMTLRQLQELIGFLQFASQVIPHSRAFIRRLIDFSMTFSSPFARRRVPAYARADIRWWHQFAHAWNGVRIIAPTYPTIHVYTDASGSKGIGGVFDDRWFSSRVPRRFRSRDIQFKEIYAVLHAILRWGHLWRHHHVVFHVDNEAIVATLAKETTRARFTMSIARQIAMLAAILEFSFSSSWLPSAMNALADAASRFEFTRLFHIAPSLSRQNCKISPRLAGIKCTLTSRPPSPSSCGMALPPPPAGPTPQANGPLSTSSASIPTCSMATALTSPRTNRRCSNGSHTWATPAEFSHQQSKPTLGTSNPYMWTPTCHSMQSNRLWYNGSFEGLSDILGTGTVGPRHQSHSVSSSGLPPFQPHAHLSSRPTLMQQSNWRSRVSYVLGSSRLKGKSTRPSIRPSTSRGGPYHSSRPPTTPPASASLFRPQRQTPLGEVSPLTLPQWKPPPAQLQLSGSSSRWIPDPPAHLFSATPTAPCSNTRTLSPASDIC
jgi:Reverse transcriptase (RNA-dependent DNA polymerase)